MVKLKNFTKNPMEEDVSGKFDINIQSILEFNLIVKRSNVCRTYTSGIARVCVCAYDFIYESNVDGICLNCNMD